MCEPWYDTGRVVLTWCHVWNMLCILVGWRNLIGWGWLHVVSDWWRDFYLWKCIFLSGPLFCLITSNNRGVNWCKRGLSGTKEIEEQLWISGKICLLFYYPGSIAANEKKYQLKVISIVLSFVWCKTDLQGFPQFSHCKGKTVAAFLLGHTV